METRGIGLRDSPKNMQDNSALTLFPYPLQSLDTFLSLYMGGIPFSIIDSEKDSEIVTGLASTLSFSQGSQGWLPFTSGWTS